MVERNFDEELKEIRKEAQEAERTKIQLETLKEEATKQKAKYEQECRDLGVDPASLDAEIEKMEKEITKVLDDIKGFLPQKEEAPDEDTEPAF